MVEDRVLQEVIAQLTGGELQVTGEEWQAVREEQQLGVVQSPTENPRLEFRDGQFFLRVTTPAGALVERYLSDASVREAFGKIPIDTGWLPPEIVRWGDGKAGEWAVAFFAPRVYELEVTRESASTADRGPQTDWDGAHAVDGQPSSVDRLSVPLPGLVFFGTRRPLADPEHAGGEKSATNYFVWAVKAEKLDPFQEIFRAPLPNVYADGRVCWGLIKPPRPTSRSLIQAFELFVKSTFNNHLADGKSRRQKEDVRVMLRERAALFATESRKITDFQYSNKVFLVEDLVRQVAHVGVTLDKALREFMETGVMAE